MKQHHVFLSVFVALVIIAFSSCEERIYHYHLDGSDYSHDIRLFGQPEFSEEAGQLVPDTMTLNFYLENRMPVDERLRRDRRMQPHANIELELMEYVGGEQVLAPEYIEGSLVQLVTEGVAEGAFIPDNITVSLVVDRSGSIQDHEMLQIRDAVEAFVNVLPEGSLFLSFFHNEVSTSYPINRAEFDAMADTLLTRTEFHTDLYNATIMKLLEFDETAEIPNIPYERQLGYANYERNHEIARRAQQGPNVLIVLTDGADDPGLTYLYPNPKYDPPPPGFTVYTADSVYKYVEKYRDHVQVFTIGFGAERSDYEPEILQEIVDRGGNPDGFFEVLPDKIIALLEVQLPDVLRPDYSARFLNPAGKVFAGEERVITIHLKDPVSGITAGGNTSYAFGSVANPVSTGEEEELQRTMLWGLLIGLLILVVVLIIMQLIWPLINNQLFAWKYHKHYKPGQGETKRSCPYCRQLINENDLVVDRCEHVVHKHCWIENSHMCPEYGQNCQVGKQNYFDINDPFSKKNKLFYLSWVFFGLVGGFLSWVVYMLIKDMSLFASLAGYLTDQFTSFNDPNRMAFISKITPLLAIGVVKGFFLSLLFAYTEEYRRINLLIALRILLRGVVGAAVGMLAFSLGSMLLLIVYIPFSNMAWDWIPWVFFGGLIGLALSFKTTIDWRHGLLGGIVSIIFSFFVLYGMAGFIGLYAVVITFMIYGAGLGAAIATVRSTSEKYFLRIVNGPREGSSIAIHKWMRARGEINEVYIGTASSNEIQINWDDSPDIAEKHAMIYVSKSQKIPVVVSLEKGYETLYDQRVEMTPGKEYDLTNGSTFQIGYTVFQYIET